MCEDIPLVMQFLTVVGFLRFVNKPLFTLLHKFFSITPWQWDEKFLNRIEQSRYYNTFSFMLDWFASIKVGPNK